MLIHLEIFKRKRFSVLLTIVVALVIAIAALGYGGFIEFVQPYVNRYGEFNDFVADGVGVCVGIAVARLMDRNWS